MMYRVFVIIISVFLSACQTLAPKHSVNWNTRSQQLAQIKNWHLVGALGIRHEHKAWNATLHWQQQQQHYTMDFVAPMGQGKMELQGSPAHVKLRTIENKVLTADSPEALLKKAMGWNIPVTYLFYWVRGLPVPELKAKIQFDQFNHIKRLDQNGWAVEYQRYTNLKGVDLPGLITVKKWPLRLRFVIKQWKIS